MPQWHVLVENWRILAQGLLVTVGISAVSFLIGMVAGVLLGIARLSSNWAIRIASRAFVELFRGLPTLVTMFAVFFVLPMVLHVNIPSFWAAVIGLSLWYVAELAEIVRGALQSIPRSQTEAAQSLAFTPWQTMRYILMPQAVRRSLPPTVGLFTRLVKGIAMGALIGVPELVFAGRTIVERTLRPLEVFGLIMVLYFLLCYPLSLWAARLERKLVV